MFGNVAVENLSPVVRDDEEADSTPKANVGTAKNHRSNRFSMVFRKAAHLFGAFRIHLETVLSEMSKPEHRQFAMYARSTPGSVLGNHAKDQFAQFAVTHFLPAQLRCRDSHFQYRLNPVRCQRTTVYGCTRTNTRFHPDQSRHISTQNNLCAMASFGSGCLSFENGELLS